MASLIQQTDVNILLWIQRYLRSDLWTWFWSSITHLGDSGWFWIALALVFLIPKKTRSTGAVMVLAMAIGGIITNLCLKNAIARIRPYDYTDQLLRLIEIQKDFSFPSGHSCVSFAGAFVCLKKLPRRYGVFLMVLAAIIALSRLYVGVHYPTDVIAGILIGLFSGWLALRMVPKCSAGISAILKKK